MWLCRPAWLVVSAALTMLWGTASGAQPASQPATTATSTHRVEIIIVAEEDEHLLPLLAPLAAKLAGKSRPPIVMAVSVPPKDHEARLIDSVLPAHRLILESGAMWESPTEVPPVKGRVAVAGTGATDAALRIAGTHWRRAPKVVVADTTDGTGAVLGSALAAHLAAPFVPVDADEVPSEMSKTLTALGVTEVVVATSNGDPIWSNSFAQKTTVLDADQLSRQIVRAIGRESVRNVVLARAPDSPGRVLDKPYVGLVQNEALPSGQAGAGWLGQLPPDSPTSGVSRAEGDPLPQALRDPAIWLAPYMSLARKAPIVLCASGDGRAAEQAVQQFVRVAGLRPRTVTILGDYLAIGVIPISPSSFGGLFEVSVEPCSGADVRSVSAYGVGRLPFYYLSDASYLFAAGLMRGRRKPDRDPEVLMVANPRTESGTLPLAETVARVTSAELRNCRLPVHEFYGVPSDDPAILQAAGTASLIIYQGHVTDQRILCPPPPADVLPPDGGLAESPLVPSSFPAHDAEVQPEIPIELTASERLAPVFPEHNVSAEAASTTVPERPVSVLDGCHSSALSTGAVRANSPVGDLRASRQADAALNVVRSVRDVSAGALPETADVFPDCPPEPPGAAEADAHDPDHPPTVRLLPAPDGLTRANSPRAIRLEGHPLVILQSCHSLEDGVAQCAFESGAVGLVGSVTNIHSASGSSFIKAYCDNTLYREATQGEALRDARNYFLCLAKLKTARGHREQAKVLRVAMSFRLWGDPELPVLPPASAPAVRRPVKARFAGRETVRVTMPARRLPESRTDRYLARPFPGSQTAGIVKRLKDKPQRRLMPLQYFRLPVPQSFEQAGYSRLRRTGEQDTRTVFLTDPHGRFVHILHFAAKESPRETFGLQFTR